jgi:hypothetical protein
MVKRVTETFFLPDEIERSETRVPADLYNLAHHLIARSEFNCVFVPVRAVQVLAIITEHEIAFVDSLSYAHQDNEGGRIILLEWKFEKLQQREALHEPVSCEVVYYNERGSEVQARLIHEFALALRQIDTHYRDQDLPADGARIIRFEQH